MYTVFIESGCTVIIVQFKGSGRANFKNFNLILFYNLLFSGYFKTCIDSSLNKMSKLAPMAMEVKKISKMF